MLVAKVIGADDVDDAAAIAALPHVSMDFRRNVPGEIDQRALARLRGPEIVVGADRDAGARKVVADLHRAWLFVNCLDPARVEPKQLEQNRRAAGKRLGGETAVTREFGIEFIE